MSKFPILKAKSPAALAEEYIVKSIWEKHFPPGSDLPAERELADKIGVTRTTLREVLQRLARDGWLSIQHGKPTKVNNIWETAGPNIISTLISLDSSTTPTIVANTVSLRTRMAEYYIPEAVRLAPEKTLALFQGLDTLQDTSEDYAAFDYNLYRQFTFIADKPVYGLILNSFKTLYHQVACLYFSSAEARQLTLTFYHALREVCTQGDIEAVNAVMAKNRQVSTVIWAEILKHLPKDFGQDI